VVGSGDSVFELSSIISDTRFDFDNEILGSGPYRQAITHLRNAGWTGRIDDASPEMLDQQDLANNGPTMIGNDIMLNTTYDTAIPEASTAGPVKGSYSIEGDLQHASQVDPIESKIEPLSIEPGKEDEGKTLGNTDSTQQSPTIPYQWLPVAHVSTKEAEGWPLITTSKAGHEPLLPASSQLLEPQQPGLLRSASARASAVKTSGTPRENTAEEEPQNRAADIQVRTLNPKTPEVQRKLVIVGDSTCGKTYALIRFAKGLYSTVYAPTAIDNYVTDVNVDGITVELALWDTSGDFVFDRIRPISYPDSHVILICFAIDDPVSLDNVQEKARISFGKLFHSSATNVMDSGSVKSSTSAKVCPSFSLDARATSATM
jgi:Ras family